MEYTRETGETHSKLISCMVQMVRGKKSLHNAGSRWAVGSSYTMHGPRGPREEFVTQCMVQVVRGKKLWEVRFVMVVMVSRLGSPFDGVVGRLHRRTSL